MLESTFQRNFLKKVRTLFPGCVILKNNPNYLQGVPDWIILYRARWAMLEIKRSSDAEEQPNQSWYVDLLDDMSYSSFVFPENEREVLYELQQALQLGRAPRVPKSEYVSLDSV